MEQVELGAIVPLFRVTDLPPAAALSEADAPQSVNEGEIGSERKTPFGNSSPSETPVRLAEVWLFRITIVSSLIPPAQMVVGLKLLLKAMGGTVGGGGVGPGGRVPPTFSVALAGLVLVIEVPSPVAESAPA